MAGCEARRVDRQIPRFYMRGAIAVAPDEFPVPLCFDLLGAVTRQLELAPKIAGVLQSLALRIRKQSHANNTARLDAVNESGKLPNNINL